jgi:hypothetical protein
VVQGDTLKVIRVVHAKRDIDRLLKKEPADDDTIHLNHPLPNRA